jgi:mono/diheme cytochrome c family protein
MKKIIIFSMASITIFFIATSFYQEFDLAKSVERGKNVYTSNCIDCHRAEGIDPSEYPPLAKSDYLQNPADTLINVLLLGQSGPVTVNGTQYNDDMQAVDYLSDTDISDVLNYIRNSWGNKGDAIIPNQVKALRKQ